MQKAEQANAEEILAEFKTNVERPGLTVKTVLRHGSVAGEIIKTAKQEKADFTLVTRRHGERNPGERLSEVANRIARYSPCSAILLDAQNSVSKSFLYATDGSRQAQTAGQRLRELGVRDSLFICTVVQTLDPVFIKTGSQAYNDYQRIVEEYQRETDSGAQKLLKDCGEKFRAPNLKVRTLTYKGDPANAILKIIKEYKIDMLAIGAKGVSAMDEFLLGSITLKMLQRATCSLLVAR
jgi:nucleotide-binding universal stress UspA family protein